MPKPPAIRLPPLPPLVHGPVAEMTQRGGGVRRVGTIRFAPVPLSGSESARTAMHGLGVEAATRTIRRLPMPPSAAGTVAETMPRPGALPTTSFSTRPMQCARVRGPAVSLAGHLLVIGVALAASMLRLVSPAPPDPPTIDLVIGTGAKVNGVPSPQPRPPVPPSPAAPPSPPVARATMPPAPAPTPQAEAQSAPPPPAQPAPVRQPSPPAARPVPPPAPQGSVAAAAPQPAPPAPKATPAPQPQPTPPPQATKLQATPAPTAPTPPTPAPPTTAAREVRPQPSSDMKVSLGEGFAAPMADIENAGIVRPAHADSGNIAPTYPQEASRRHQYGTVILGIDIAPDGHAANVRVLQSSGYRLLDESALTRLRTWHFTPATKDGIPVEDSIQFEIHFDP